MYSTELASNYSKFRDQFNETDKELFSVVALIVIQDKDILDFGCGDGRYALHLKEMGAHKVVGIDVSEKMIEMANSHKGTIPDVDFIVADGRKLPLPDASFDLVFSNFVIHYFEKASDVFKEISRVLKPGGYFIGTFNVADVTTGNEHLFNTNMPIRLGAGETSVVVQNLIKSRDEISVALSENKLEMITEKELDHPNAIIDPSFEHADKVSKHVICMLARKV